MDNELRESWIGLCRLADVSEVTSALWYDIFLLPRYTDSTRHYHTLSHVAECLAEFDHLDRAQMEDPIALEMAIWFHDAEYSTDVDDNEARSAELATSLLTRAKVPDARVTRVQDHVMTTKHEGVPVQLDTQLMADIDLSILGKPPARFEEYEQQIRKEYCDASDSIYSRGRQYVLQQLLERPLIYCTSHFQDRYEVTARRNLVNAIQQIKAKEHDLYYRK
jgi:predicted metal-dependent HD superfamily phosphohydrolase